MQNSYTWIILGLAMAWVLQLALSLWQMRRFYARFNELRKAGISAIGTAGSIYGGRVYVVLVADEDNQIVHAEKLSGWTVFAQLRPVEPLLGRTLTEVVENDLEGVPKKIRKAFRNAAEDILTADQKKSDITAPESTAETDDLEQKGGDA
jgi:DNA-binding transcriptional regulator of glucitol operon